MIVYNLFCFLILRAGGRAGADTFATNRDRQFAMASGNSKVVPAIADPLLASAPPVEVDASSEPGYDKIAYEWAYGPGSAPVPAVIAPLASADSVSYHVMDEVR
jgi:hypothetical protein